MELSDVKAVVTGGGSGMGREFTLQLARAGGDVVFCDVNPAALAETAEIAADLAGSVSGVVANVAEEDDVVNLMAEARDALGAPNVLVNNAGILRDGLLVKRDRKSGEMRWMSRDHWQAVIDVNLTGPFQCAREFARCVVEAETRPAVIVNMSSLARHGNRGQSNYAAAKAGLIADTQTWATELAPHGVRVGAIAPGLVETPILLGMPDKARQALVDAVPAGRLGRPAEIFMAVKFIIECEYFTGRCIDVDGGLRFGS